MRCEYCKIEIEGNVGICPLCHEVLSDERGTITKFPLPDKTKKKPKTRTKVILGYVFIVSLVSLRCLFINVSIPLIGMYQWWIIVAGTLFYGVFLFRNTIFSYLSAGQRTFWQFIYLLGFMYAVEAVFGLPPFVTAYGLPLVCFTAVSTIFLYILIAKKYVRQNTTSVILLSVLGFLPLIFYFTRVTAVLWPALVSGSVSAAAALFTVIFSRKYLADEFERKFHM
jgi:hypothetical protein